MKITHCTRTCDYSAAPTRYILRLKAMSLSVAYSLFLNINYFNINIIILFQNKFSRFLGCKITN
jgi:hypothetical protein